MEQSKIPVRNPLVVLREEFDDWAILFDPDTANAVGINPVGVVIWTLIDGKREIKDIIVEVTERFSGISQSVDAEISAFIDELHENGFVGYCIGRA